MTIALQEWLDGHTDRTSGRQRANVDTSKLVATFSVGIVATIAATALQVGKPSSWDVIAVVLLALSFAFTLGVILLDRLTVADSAAIMQIAHIANWSHSKTLTELRVASLAASLANEAVVRSVRIATVLQVFISVLGGAAAIVSLLQGS